MRYDTRARRTVLRLPRQRLDDLAWSPDDRQLAFAGGQGIRVVNLDGKGLRRLSRGRDSSPTWSPDGKTVAFSRELRGVSQVLQMRADGTGHRRIATRAERPAFSPDGATIAFLRNGSIWLMDAEGGRHRRSPRGRVWSHRFGLVARRSLPRIPAFALRASRDCARRHRRSHPRRTAEKSPASPG